MTKSVDTKNGSASETAAPKAAALTEEVRESAKEGQHAAREALQQFRHTVDEVIPDAVQPLRNRIVEAAIELADQLVTAQYNFNRSIVRAADHALSSPKEH